MVFIADRDNQRIRRIGLNGTIETIAGTGAVGTTGVGGAALAAALECPYGVVVGQAGRVFVVDERYRVVQVY